MAHQCVGGSHRLDGLGLVIVSNLAMADRVAEHPHLAREQGPKAYARVIEYDVPDRFFWPLTVARSLRGSEVAGRCPVLGCSVHESRLGDQVTGAVRRAGLSRVQGSQD